MKVAFFVQYSHTAGTYFRWHNLAIALRQAGVIVDVYAGDFNYKAQSRREQRDGVNYYITPSFISCRIFTNPSDPVSALRRLLNLPSEKYDVYHLFQPFLQAFAPWNYLRKKSNAVFIYDWDDLWTGGLFNEAKTMREKYVQRIVRALEKKLPKISDGVTVCSSFLKDRSSCSATQVLYNGFWEREQRNKKACREKWGLSDGLFYLAYIGKTANELSWIKSALDKLGENHNDVGLVIVGPPRQTVASVGLLDHSRVKYLGEVTPDDAAEIATASDLGLIPLEDSAFNKSRFPIKFFDFLVAGTPVYFSGVGEIKMVGKEIPASYEGSADTLKWSLGLGEVITQVRKDFPIVDVKELSARYGWTAIGKQLSYFYQSLDREKKG